LSNSVPEPARPQSPAALRLSIAWAASGFGGGIYTPFFGAWLAWKGLNPAQIGLLLSIGMLLRVIVSPLTAIVADARNDRRSMMIVLMAAQLVGYLGLSLVVTPFALFVVAILANVAGSSYGPLMESVSLRLAERYGFDYGRVRLWNSSVFAATNLLSGLAISQWGMIVLAPWLTLSTAGAMAAVIWLPAPPKGHRHGQLGVKLRATLAEARELLGSAAFLIFLLAASFDQGSHAFYYAYGGLHWRALGYSGTLIGALWPLGIVGEALLFSVSLRVMRTLGVTRLLLLGGIGCVLRWSVLSLDPALPFVVLVQFGHVATFAMAHLGAMYFLAQAVPPRLAATAQSLYAVMSNGVVMGLATFASGPIYAAYGGRTYLLMAAMGVVSVLFSLWLARAWHGGRITAHVGEEVGDAI
jgi:PPP family 3-phenylpropionic acid transporter